MSGVATAAVIMGGLGLFFGTVLAVAARVLRVEEDPRLEQLEEMLPGTNCGACGEPGCFGFALQLLAGAKAPSRCTVSGPDAIDRIAMLLGVDPGSLDRQVARLHCAGGRGRAEQLATYEGYESCRGASLTGGGGLGCAWGCLGLGDCAVVCGFGAIRMTRADEEGAGMPKVDVNLCTACGDCVEGCPKDLFELLPLRQPLVVQCSVPLAGEEATALCTVACDACGRCAQDAREGLIRMDGNLPVVDYEAASRLDDEGATARCPTGAIRWVVRGQFAPPKAQEMEVRRVVA